MSPKKVNFEGKISVEGEKKVAVIVIGIDKGDIEVFDGEGNPAEEAEFNAANPLHGLKKVHNLTVLSTKTNPYCVWVYTPAGWRKVCY
ncbi:MAG: hypothetical protein HGA63_03635 [Syntrophobacteraceae bacterium]|nr:hypothetical protein [Syntrophobacteraceae bacterium]